MDLQQTQTQFPSKSNKKRSRRRFLISAIILAAVTIATVLALSSLGLIPGFLATIISAFATIFATVFTLLPLFPTKQTPETLSTNLPSEIKVIVQSPAPSGPSAPPTKLWTVPTQRNPFFTGREDLLLRLHERLTANRTTALTQSQAIHGLGGIGKTQVALEYAYRYRDEYTAMLWLNAQSAESLLTEFIALAEMLQLPQPEKDEHYQTHLITVIHQWFVQQEHWLLILDNADDLQAIKAFIPTGGKGHLILTTREYATGSFTSLTIEEMDQEEGITFLLRRAKVLQPDSSLETISQQDRLEARAIVTALDGLPLALDQAGAYLEETPSCSLSAYLERYQRQQRTFLDRRGRNSDHLSVRATFLLCFTQVSEQNPLGADLLRCLAFLNSEDIPTAMLREGAGKLGPRLETITKDEALLDEAISILLRYSLVHYHPERQAFSVHRLVQTVLKEEMSAEEQQQWKKRVVQAINRVFPSSDVTTWQQCQRYLPHAQVCAVWIEKEHLWFSEAGSLLTQMAGYLRDRALYSEALSLYQRALAIGEEVLGPKHPNTATGLNNLANLYQVQGDYEHALPLHQRALAIREEVLGPKHPNTVSSLNNLANLYARQEDYEHALPLYQRALTIGEEVLGPKHPDTASSLNNLANLYTGQEDYEHALPLCQRALAIREEVLGPKHPDTATSLNNLATLYAKQEDYEHALPLYQRALAIREEVLGPKHPDTASSLNNLAVLYAGQEDYKHALPLYQRALAIREEVLGPKHPNTATSLNNLAALYAKQEDYEHALPLYQRALTIKEEVLGPKHPDAKTARAKYDKLLKKQSKKP